MLETGGNAVDAGVAAIFAAATTEYSHVGWGGETPILIRAKDGRVHAIAGVGAGGWGGVGGGGGGGEKKKKKKKKKKNNNKKNKKKKKKKKKKKLKKKKKKNQK